MVDNEFISGVAPITQVPAMRRMLRGERRWTGIVTSSITTMTMLRFWRPSGVVQGGLLGEVKSLPLRPSSQVAMGMIAHFHAAIAGLVSDVLIDYRYIFNTNIILVILDTTGLLNHPTTPVGLYETMQLPDPVLGNESVKNKKHNMKVDPAKVARMKDREEIKRRKGDAAKEARRDERCERKRRRVEEEGYVPVSGVLMLM